MPDPIHSEPDRSRLAVDEDLLADGALLLVAEGDLDIGTAPQLASHLRRAVAGELDVIVDVSDVGFMDSTGVAVLLNGLRRLTRCRRQLVLVAPSGPVRRLLEVTGLHDTFPMAPTLRAARAALRAGTLPMRGATR
jgi:anti-anti-sigma factor